MMKSELYMCKVPLRHPDEYDALNDKYRALTKKIESLTSYISDMEAVLKGNRLETMFHGDVTDIWFDVVIAHYQVMQMQEQVEEIEAKAEERAKANARIVIGGRTLSREERDELRKEMKNSILAEDEEYHDALRELELAKENEAMKKNEYVKFQMNESATISKNRGIVEANIQRAREEIEEIERQRSLILDNLEQISYSDNSGYQKKRGSRKSTNPRH